MKTRLFTAAAIGTTIWAIITAVTNYQIGWMVIGVGCLVGFAVLLFGKGQEDFGAAAEFPYPLP